MCDIFVGRVLSKTKDSLLEFSVIFCQVCGYNISTMATDHSRTSNSRGFWRGVTKLDLE